MKGCVPFYLSSCSTPLQQCRLVLLRSLGERWVYLRLLDLGAIAAYLSNITFLLRRKITSQYAFGRRPAPPECCFLTAYGYGAIPAKPFL